MYFHSHLYVGNKNPKPDHKKVWGLFWTHSIFSMRMPIIISNKKHFFYYELKLCQIQFSLSSIIEPQYSNKKSKSCSIRLYNGLLKKSQLNCSFVFFFYSGIKHKQWIKMWFLDASSRIYMSRVRWWANSIEIHSGNQCMTHKLSCWNLSIKFREFWGLFTREKFYFSTSIRRPLM